MYSKTLTYNKAFVLYPTIKHILVFLFLLGNYSDSFAQSFQEIKELLPNEAEIGDQLAATSSIFGNYAVVGASTIDNSTGTAYIYEKDKGGLDNWGLVKKIQASDKKIGDRFGASVSIHNDYIIIGADSEVTGGNNAGAVYIFQKDHGGINNWGEVKKIQASDKEADDYFGRSLSLYGNILAVGSGFSGEFDAGSVYIFQKDYGGIDNWGEVKKIQASDMEAGDYFGVSISVYEDYIVVGAPSKSASPNIIEAGAVYIFQKDHGGINNWGEVKKIQASDIEEYHYFGSVSIFGDYLVVGASGEYISGTAYVFQKDYGGIDNWGEVKKIQASDIEEDDAFGYSVSIFSNYLVVGNPGRAFGINGAAHIFQKDHGGINNWGEVQKITESNENVNYFGESISMSNNYIIVGALNEEVSAGTFASAAYIFKGTIECSLNPSITGDLEYCSSGGSTTLDAGNWSSYLWSTGETTRFITVTEGTYSVQVTDFNGCSGTSDAVTVVENGNLNPSISGDLEYCGLGGSTTLDAGNWNSYLWSNGETTRFIIATEGTYSVQVTDSNDCTGTSEPVTVVENGNLNPSITGNLEYCSSGGSTTLDAGNWSSYLWSTGETTRFITVTEGTYSVQVTDFNGCSGTSEQVTVVENGNLNPSITGDLEYCGLGGSTTLDAGNWSTYLWSTGETTRFITATAGTYSVQVTGSNGCSGTSEQVTVIENGNLTPIIMGDLEYCEVGGSTTLDAGDWSSYLWSTGETTRFITATAGTYSVEVVDSNGCLGVSDVVTVFLNENFNPVEFIENGSFESAQADPGNTWITLPNGNNSINSWTIESGDIDYKVVWEASEGLYSIDMNGTGPGIISQSFNTIIGDTYTVTFDLAGNTNGGPTIKKLNVSAGNSSMDYSFNTSGHSHQNMGWTSHTFVFTATECLTTLSFSSLVSGYHGPAIDNVNIMTGIVNPDPVITGNLTYCASEGSTVLDAGDWSSYLWSNGETTRTIAATEGTYNVVVMNSNGVSSTSETVSVVKNENPNPSILSTGVGNEQTLLDAGNWSTYLWLNGETTQTILVTEGTYSVEVTDSNACVGTAEYTVIGGGGSGIDLELSISSNKMEFNLYESITYTIAVTNKGGIPATGVKVMSTVPSEMAFTSQSASKGSYNLWSGMWTVGTLNPGETARLEMVLFTLSNSGSISNFAQVTAANETDIDSTPNNMGSIPTEDDEGLSVIVPRGSTNNQIDLALSKTANVGLAKAGDVVTYQLTVVNNGTVRATGVSVEDVLPSNLTFTGAIASKGTYNEGTGIWNIGVIEVGESEMLTLHTRVDVLVLPMTNFAQIKTANETDVDSTPNNNSGTNPQEDDEDSVLILPDLSDTFVDIELTTTFSSNTAQAGDQRTYKIMVTNKGLADAIGVTVVDEMPSELTLIGATTAKGTYNNDGIWSVGNLNSGETAILNLDVMVDVFTDPIVYFTQVQTASPDDSDSRPGNDNDRTANEDDEASATLILSGTSNSDLETTMTSSVPNLDIWTKITFTMEITNKGVSVATGVKASFPVPTGMAFTSKTTTKGNYNLWAQEWTIGILQPNETARLDLTLFVLDESSDLTFYGEIIAANEDDLDSMPANGNGFSPVEDDEAVVIVLANGSGGGKVDLNANIVGRSALLTVNRIYPVPTSDVVNIIFTSKTENVDMILYDFSGRVVYEQTLQVVEGENATQIDLTSFPAGWYFVSMETEDGSVRAKMVKQ